MPLVSVSEFLNTQFNHVIVGGGTAGLTVAARLSEDPNVIVGVIEAGEYHPNDPKIDIPGKIGRMVANPTYDWTFFSSPQIHASNRAILQPRGKGLGGSSMINAMIMTRPSKEECDALEHLGNSGWNWESLLDCMKKSEKAFFGKFASEIAESYAVTPDKSFHGSDGPIVKSFPHVLSETQPLLFDTAQNLGVPRNGKTLQKRSYAASAYYEPYADRPNLKVLTRAQVTKLLLDSDSNTDLQCVKALEFHHDDTRAVLERFHNVVLSAGSFQTPQLLELSGIGDEARLSAFGIKMKVSLPGVGENLQDHIGVPTIARIDSKFETVDILVEPEQLKKHEELYKSQQGFLSILPVPAFLFVPAQGFGSVAEIGSWKQQADDAESVTAEDLHPTLKQGLKKQYEIQARWLLDATQPQAEIINYNGHRYFPHLAPLPGNRYITLLATLMHPLSRGSVHISSADPLAPPTIDPNYFGVETDLDILVSILKFTLKLYKTQPLGDIVRGFVLPPQSVDVDNEEVLREYVKANVGPVFHPIGTASMLPREDGGVVDSKLRVYGTSNLRVVDLSVFPLQVATHPQSIAYAVGEKAADIIKSLV